MIEIGCGPGAAAREVARRVGSDGHVLAIDRSAKAIGQLEASSADLIHAGRLSVRCVSIEEFELPTGDDLYDLAFAVRVGVLDGRHPDGEAAALQSLARALTAEGRLFIDGGNPLTEIVVPRA